MKILYLWAEEYKGLKNINLCFDGKYNFKHEIKEESKENEDKESILYIEKNSCYRDIIKNISCIVGENGSGKTRVLKLIGKILNIYDKFLHHYNNEILYKCLVINDVGNFILILEDTNGELLFFSNLNLKNTELFNNILIPEYYELYEKNIPFLAIYFIEQSTFENKNSAQIKYEFIHKNIEYIEYKDKNIKNIEYKDKTIKTIYYFGKMDELELIRREIGIFDLDISTNGFLHRDRDYSNNPKDNIFIYLTRNIIRHLKFHSMCSNKKNNIKFRLPDLILRFRNPEQMIEDYYNEKLVNRLKYMLKKEKLEKEKLEKEKSEKIKKKCKDLLSKVYIENEDNNYETDIVDFFNKCILASVLIFHSDKIIKEENDEESDVSDVSDVSEESEESESKSFICIKKIIVNFYSEKEFYEITNKIKQLNLFLKKEKFNKKFNLFDRNLFLQLGNNKENDKEVIEFIDNYYSLNFNDYYSGFFPEWKGMSSGELIINDIYSRIFDLTVFPNSEIIYDKNYIFLFDEIDLNLHPELQRQIVTHLVSFIEKEFEHKNIQIIFSTHSPIILSDFESKNVIFLKGETSEKPSFQTFGQNIHTLFRYSFFLESTIGEFASKKIKEVIEDLTYKTREELEKDTKRKEEIEYIISIIGEPIIKRKLELMYKEIFPENIEDYKMKIKKLEEEKQNLLKLVNSSDKYTIDSIMELLNQKIKELKSKIGDKND